MNLAAESPKGAPLYAVQHGVSSVGVGVVGIGGFGGLILVVVVLIGLIALGCGPPF
jgi:hypothetical protein